MPQLFERLRAAGRKVAISPPILVEIAGKLRSDKKVRDWLELPDADLETYLADLPRLCLLTAGGLEAGACG